MKQKSLLSAGLLMLLVSSCSDVPSQAYINRGGPESLLDVSSERIHLTLTSESDIDELVRWLNEDQPSALELNCSNNAPLCSRAMEVAHQFAVPIEYGNSSTDGMVLVYDRIIARDCNNTYVSNYINPYNMPQPTFGCSLAANSLQMISDKKQIVAPALMDYPDAEKAAQSVTDRYKATSAFKQFEDVFEFKGDSGG